MSAATIFKCGHPRTPDNTLNAFSGRASCRTCRDIRDALRFEHHRERNREMVRLAREGMGMAELVERFGISRSRIRCILIDHGVPYGAPFASDPLFPQRAAKVAATLAGVSPGDLSRADFKPMPAVRARWAFSIVMRERGASLPQIGRRLRRDHSTVIHGIRRGSELMRTDSEFAELVEKVRAA